MNSFREISKKMDSVCPANSLRELIEMHRWAPSETQTFGHIVSRHSSRRLKTRRFLCMNTFLMDTFLVQEKPAVSHRAREFGKVIKKNHDLALLQEIFEDDVKDIILKAWPRNNQPSIVEDAFSVTQGSSGLVTINQKDVLRNKKFHEFDNEEGSDSFADKGVLFSTIDIGLGSSKLEIYNTHLNSAGNRARKLQLLELVSFIDRTHKKGNVAILAGDFNLAPDDSIAYTKEPKLLITGGLGNSGNFNSINKRFSKHIKNMLSSNEFPNGMTEYEVIKSLLELIGFTDLWAERNGTLGYTSNVHKKSTRQKICKPAKDNPRLCDDFNVATNKAGSKRIDYIFVSKPEKSHSFALDFTRPRRVRYERAQNAPLREDRVIEVPTGMVGSGQFQKVTIKGIDMLSDHIGLSTSLLFSPA